MSDMAATMTDRAALLLSGAVCAMLACAVSSVARAAVDTCVEDGGTAFCVAPEVGPYRYQVSNGNFVTQGSSEAPTVAAFTQKISDFYKPCTFNVVDNLPPPPPVQAGSGSASAGNYTNALYFGVGQYWSVNWWGSVESHSTRIPLVYSGTYPASGSSPCSQSFGPFGAYVYRTRIVTCPGRYADPYRPNASAPSNAYCYRAANALDPVKNLGQQCGLGNPVNVGTGNKYQLETDYVGQGAVPLRFERFYNSDLWKGMSPPTAGAGYLSPLGPNWRSSYDRSIRFSDSLRFATAYAYRPDGRTLYFKLTNGQFVPDADIADRLVRLVDGSGNPVGWQYTTAETDNVETYDNSGRLNSITSRAGLIHTLAYDGNGRLSTVTDSFGRAVNFGYDSNERMSTEIIR